MISKQFAAAVLGATLMVLGGTALSATLVGTTDNPSGIFGFAGIGYMAYRRRHQFAAV